MFTPIISIPWYIVPALLVAAPFVLAYDRYKTRRWQRLQRHQ